MVLHLKAIPICFKLFEFATGASSQPLPQSLEPPLSTQESGPRTLSGISADFLLSFAICFFAKLSVVFCEAVAIFGVIMSIVLFQKVNGAKADITFNDDETYSLALYYGFCIFWCGLAVGFSNFVCGYFPLAFLIFSICVGVAGHGCALSDAANTESFIKCLVIEIFGSAIGLFGLIIGIIQSGKADFAGLA